MNRRERKKEKTKVSIINFAVDIFREKGFHKTSMEEIAEKSDVSKGTLYNYFRDKESILVGYYQFIISKYAEDINQSFAMHNDINSQLDNLLDFINNIFKNDLEFAAIYFSYRMQSLFNKKSVDSLQRSGIESLVMRIVKQAQDNQELRVNIPLVIIARNFQLLYMNFFVLSIYDKENFDVDLLKSQLIELFLNGAKL